MDRFELQKRTKKFAIAVIRLTRLFPTQFPETKIITNQIIRSSSSTAANYRAACRAKSHRDFIFKLGIVIEECDETSFWLEFSEDAELVKPEEVMSLKKEANELVAIMTASQITAKRNS
jgi:four helix bundle protein